MNTTEGTRLESPDPGIYIEELKEFINKLCPLSGDADTREGMCEEVSASVKKFFDERGIRSQIIEGEVNIGEKEHLVHRINLISSGSHVWVIDLSSKQIPKLQKEDWIIQKLPNDPEKIKSFLKDHYNWWSPKE